MDRLDQALDYYNQALHILEEVGNHREQTNILYYVAIIYRDQGHLREALSVLEMIIKIDSMSHHPDLESSVKTMLAQVEEELALKQAKMPTR
jgi:tetratricopeptide (TPR) repeat protein